MKKLMKVAAICAAVAMTTTACAGSPVSWSGPKKVRLGDTMLISDDAKKRYIMTAVRQTGNGRTERITCAEPSPDVATATSQAFSAAARASGQGSGSGDSGSGSMEAGGGVSSNFAESIAQLGQRATTVQLLRDSLYRACEAYANGAIDESMYSVIVSRTDDLMVTLLMAELMSGSTSATARAVAPGVAASVNLSGGAGGGGDLGRTDGSGAGGAASADTFADLAGRAGAVPGGSAAGAIIASGEHFVSMHNSYLNDLNATLTTFSVACITELSKDVPTDLRPYCETYVGGAINGGDIATRARIAAGAGLKANDIEPGEFFRDLIALEGMIAQQRRAAGQ